MLNLLSRLFLFLAEACDPSLQADRVAYEQEKAILLTRIRELQNSSDALTEYANQLENERDEAKQKIEQLKRGLAAISEKFGTDHTADLSDDAVLRAPLFSAGSGEAA